MMRLTTRRWALERGEVMTTSAAVGVSTALYLRYGHAYLARGVVGDTVGFGFLAGLLTARRRRLRHEAVACLGTIFVVLVIDPQWPLRPSSASWWLVFAVGLSGYVLIRHRLLAKGTAKRA
jgi:hypothetical protein